jgi:hypothetical protein
MPSRQGCWPATVLGYPGRESVARAHGVGGVAEWLRQGPAKPCTRVRFPSPPRGRLAQWESASFDDTEATDRLDAAGQGQVS